MVHDRQGRKRQRHESPTVINPGIIRRVESVIIDLYLDVFFLDVYFSLATRDRKDIVLIIIDPLSLPLLLPGQQCCRCCRLL